MDTLVLRPVTYVFTMTVRKRRCRYDVNVAVVFAVPLPVMKDIKLLKRFEKSSCHQLVNCGINAKNVELNFPLPNATLSFTFVGSGSVPIALNTT